MFIGNDFATIPIRTAKLLISFEITKNYSIFSHFFFIFFIFPKDYS